MEIGPDQTRCQVGGEPACLTLELVDGGYGDADGAANGIIIDPFGIAEEVAGSDDGGDTEEGDDSSDSSGCFVSSIFKPGSP